MGLELILLKIDEDFNGWENLKEERLIPFRKEKFIEIMKAKYKEFIGDENTRSFVLDNVYEAELFFDGDDFSKKISVNIHGENKAQFIKEITALLDCKAYTFEGIPIDDSHIQEYDSWIKKAIKL